MARPVRSLRTPGSSNREIFSPHGDRIADLSRDRPDIPGVYTDLADVDYSGSVYDGQAWGYDSASGMHVPRSTMYPYGTGAVPVALGSTGPLELLYNGAAWKLQARLAVAGTSTTTLVMKLNGTTVVTLNLTSGVLSNFVLLSSGSSPVLPYIALMASVDIVVVQVTAAGAGATGLQGYLAA